MTLTQQSGREWHLACILKPRDSEAPGAVGIQALLLKSQAKGRESYSSCFPKPIKQQDVWSLFPWVPAPPVWLLNPEPWGIHSMKYQILTLSVRVRRVRGLTSMHEND